MITVEQATPAGGDAVLAILTKAGEWLAAREDWMAVLFEREVRALEG